MCPNEPTKKEYLISQRKTLHVGSESEYVCVRANTTLKCRDRDVGMVALPLISAAL